MMEWLKGKKTVIVFGVILLNGILNLLGWGLELPAEQSKYVVDILAVLAIVLRYFSDTAIFKSK